MNTVILIGRICSDPEIRQTQAGKNVASYRIAVDRRFKAEGQPTADFLSCVAFGNNADFANRFIKKGMRIAIEGSIQTGSYEKDGVKHYTTDIIVDRHEFCESKKEDGDDGHAAPEPLPDMIPIEDEDLPF